MNNSFTPKLTKRAIKVIGCGLAGAELAFILANNGFDVHIFDNNKILDDLEVDERDMRDSFPYYDKYETFLSENMKFELECLNSPLFFLSKKYGYTDFGYRYDKTFMMKVRKELEANPRIKIFNSNIDELTNGELTVLASGHYTNKQLFDDIERRIGKFKLCHFEPQKMVLEATNVNFDKLNFVSEHECFANITEEEFNRIFQIISTENKRKIDEIDLTAESYAKRGVFGLRNAVFRPRMDKNLKFPPYASLKMRYNSRLKVFIVDEFFSKLADDLQKKILCQIEALKDCCILRYSNVVRKTYLLAPACVNEKLQLKNDENVFVCGGVSGTAGSFEGILTANYCAYSLIEHLKRGSATQILQENTCIGLILENLLKKSVSNFRLFNLKYDIINKEDVDLKMLNQHIEVQKILSKSQIEKFKEKFYGKYF